MTRHGVPDTSGAGGMPPEYPDDDSAGPAASDESERAAAAEAVVQVGKAIGKTMKGSDDREQPSVQIKTNIDPDHRFVSLEYIDVNGRRTIVGVMNPGTHEFSTAPDIAEDIYVVDGGSMGIQYRQKGGEDPDQADLIRPGDTRILTKDSPPMTIPSNTAFTVTVMKAPVGYRSVFIPQNPKRPGCGC